MTVTVGIIGGGFIGKALAAHLNREKYTVSLSYRSKKPEKPISGIEYCYCDLNEDNPQIANAMLNVDCMVICIPPGFRNGVGDFYATRIKTLLDVVHEDKVKQVIFTSSTGIYTQESKISEKTAIDTEVPKAKVLFDAEQAVLSSRVKNRHVLRLGGLLGGDAENQRHPGKFNVQLTEENADSEINMVMQDDVIKAITAIIQQPERASELYNVVSPHHPTRQSFYRRVWRQHEPRRPLPAFVTGNNKAGKWVDGDKICQELDFSYKYDNWFTAFQNNELS